VAVRVLKGREMKRIVIHLFVLALLVAACSAPKDRAECSASVPCGAGEYCAHTPDGSVCWPDTVAPTLQAVTVTCGTPCLRDGTLQVSATVTDDQELVSVEASIPALSAARSVPMSLSSGKWVAAIPLAGWPFPAFEMPIAVRVTARDAAQNPAQLDAVGGNVPVVTRLKGRPYDAGVPITSPAVLADGTVVFGRSATDEQVVAVRNGEKVWGAKVGSAFVTAAPSIGDSIWIGNQGGALYPVSFIGDVGAECATGEPINAPAAIAGSRAIAGSQAAIVAVAGPNSVRIPTSVEASVIEAPVVDADGMLYLAAGNALNSFTIQPLGSLRDNWTGKAPLPTRPTLSGTVRAALAIAGSGEIVTLASNGMVDVTTPAAVTGNLTTTSPGSTGPIILSDSSIIIGDATGVLKRIADPAPPWTDSATLNGVPAIPLVLEADEPTLLVPTSTGRLYAVRTSDGTIAWSVKLSGTGQALQPANVFTAPGASTSTAYIGGADGKLYAVIVDGRLDTAAPWPKAFHDPRNTSNAGVTP
jgi:outer membrane protein assembly factor BamB